MLDGAQMSRPSATSVLKQERSLASHSLSKPPALRAKMYHSPFFRAARRATLADAAILRKVLGGLLCP